MENSGKSFSSAQFAQSQNSIYIYIYALAVTEFLCCHKNFVTAKACLYI